MTVLSDALVFDTGPLRHFAVNGWLGVLKFLAGDRLVIVPESVEHELKNQVYDQPALRQVLDADWISVDRSNDMIFMIAFAGYEQRLVANGRNRGECGVLALGKTRGFEIVVDDSVPRTIAEEESIRVTATLRCSATRYEKGSSRCLWWRRLPMISFRASISSPSVPVVSGGGPRRKGSSNMNEAAVSMLPATTRYE